jgi:hypothetical protein
VTPRRKGNDFVIEISLKEQVGWRQGLDGDTLFLDFERPARAGRAPAAPPSAAPAPPTLVK